MYNVRSGLAALGAPLGRELVECGHGKVHHSMSFDFPQ